VALLMFKLDAHAIEEVPNGPEAVDGRAIAARAMPTARASPRT
jgi:hypothetical protein